MRMGQGEAGSLTLHLLDSAQGHAIQTWQFEGRTRISIGRAAENDISLADRQVSRVHVELLYGNGGWLLHSLGRNGTLMDGAVVSEVSLADQAIFQLGSGGPSFQFVTATDSVACMGTVVHLDKEALDFLVIDEQRRAEDVRQITEGEAFRKLQQEAQRLKHGKCAQESDS